MVDSRCHSFEDIPSIRNHHASLTCSSRSESSDDGILTGLTACFATINLSLHELHNTSQISLTHLPADTRPNTPHPLLKENRITNPSSPERGRMRARVSPNGDVPRGAFRSPSSPDRFIPKREYMDPPSTPFRVNKHPHLLSPRERFLRRRVPGHDPFLPTARRPPNFPGQKSIPTRLRQRPHQRPGLVTASMFLGGDRTDFLRQVSSGSVWGVGGISAIRADPSAAVSNGSRNDAGRGTMAPNYVARFLPRRTAADNHNKHESRLALALDIDPTGRLLETSVACTENHLRPTSTDHERYAPFVWKDNAWKKAEKDNWPPTRVRRPEIVPPKPFRILDAPFLRDDFYCSTLAYSFTSGILAVGLAQFVYLWSEGISVNHPPFGDVHPSNYVTSLSFSSESGGRSILAVGRQSGQLTLWSVFDSTVRFELSHPNSISCATFKPRTTRQNSERFPGLEVDAEELVVGDEMGNVWYYSVEWPVIQNKWSWTGSMTLLAKITAHTQQVCGLAWSPDERYLATGGNDNVCLLFDLHELIPAPVLNHSAYSPASSSLGSSPDSMTFHTFPCLNISNTPGISRGRLRFFNREHIVNHLLPSWAHPPTIRISAASPVLSKLGTLISGLGKTVIIPPNRQKYRLQHGAAVKAIAFAPWQPTLLATGGGSNDRAIHFFHSRTGVCLATINVFAQVTSLIWSQTRREIAATFGYAQPEHPFRIAVFAWPSCAQVAVIPWGPYGSSWDGHERDVPSYDCGRALWAVGYPGRKSRLSVPVKEGDSSIIGETSSSYAASPTSSTSNRPQFSSASGIQADSSARRDRTTVQPKEKEGGMWCTRTIEEGCIIVASSDQTVKFHEIWTGRRTSIGLASGLFGGSDILESMEGIEKSGSEVIR